MEETAPGAVDVHKRLAAAHAVRCIRSGSILGLGAGSTVAFVVRAVHERLRRGELEDLLAVVCSSQSAFAPIGRPRELAARLSERAGIVEHGLFLGLATDVIVAGPAGVRHLVRPQAATTSEGAPQGR